MKKIFIAIVVGLAAIQVFAAKEMGTISTTNLEMHRVGDRFQLSLDFVLDSLRLGGNRQLYVVPVVEDADSNREVMPALLINGRNMHYAYERRTMPGHGMENYVISKEVRRYNGKPQTVGYMSSVMLRGWMMRPGAQMRLVVDTCGCGRAYGSSPGNPQPLNLNPAPRMRVAYYTPEVTPLPVSVHEGKARVQFEVDRTELHAEPYKCRNGQLIDNREQIKIIEDSVRYALSDPNVEISQISICGYASPESPYMHNEYLATNRSRALSEYIGQKFNLPSDRCSYSSVPENWIEFRELVAKADGITETQRRDLLELIDRPAYGASDYDAKERELKTDKRFASLYRTRILPEWFPLLRATKFAISTRLKPLSDQELAKVIETTPRLMSLNQMFRVAKLYPEGSAEFDHVIGIALEHYPDDPVANLNSAIAAINRGDWALASALLENSGGSAEAENARGVVATNNGDFEAARRHFKSAGNLPEAVKNLKMLE